MVLVPKVVIDTRERILKNKTITKILIRWGNVPHEDATWENAKILEHPIRNCLRASNSWKGGLSCPHFRINLMGKRQKDVAYFRFPVG